MPNGKAENDPKPVDFEAAMRDLEEIVERLEHGELPLEESLAAFERGVISLPKFTSSAIAGPTLSRTFTSSSITLSFRVEKNDFTCLNPRVT